MAIITLKDLYKHDLEKFINIIKYVISNDDYILNKPSDIFKFINVLHKGSKNFDYKTWGKNNYFNGYLKDLYALLRSHLLKNINIENDLLEIERVVHYQSVHPLPLKNFIFNILNPVNNKLFNTRYSIKKDTVFNLLSKKNKIINYRNVAYFLENKPLEYKYMKETVNIFYDGFSKNADNTFISKIELIVIS